MDTEIELVAAGPSHDAHRAALADARAFARSWEGIFSRFDPASTLSRVNAAAGATVPGEPVCTHVLARAMQAVAATGGRFDPAILPALEALGYDRTFGAIGGLDGGASAPGVWSAHPAWEEVELDHARGTVRLPDGMRIDLGGIAKGAFVDRLAGHLAAWPGGCVNAGGDLRLWGSPPDGDAWRVAIDDPRHPGTALTTLAITASSPTGVATSGASRRRWSVNGEARHHLVDPRTGRSAVTSLASVTVVAASATDAEIAAKALLLGHQDLIHGDLAIVVNHQGETRTIERSRPDAEVTLLP